jgi:hypothetical protein
VALIKHKGHQGKTLWCSGLNLCVLSVLCGNQAR